MRAERNIGCPGSTRSSSRAIDQVVTALAARQNGRVARWQLLEAGILRDAIGWRIRSGFLIPIHPGVYAVGHRDGGNLGVWSSAVLLGGPDAVLSHRAASGLRALLPAPTTYSDVTSPHRRARRSGLRWHRAAVPPDERELIDNIPVTSLHRTLIDLASIVTDDQLDQAIEVAGNRAATDLVPMEVMLERHRGRRGIARLRRVIDGRIEGGYRVGELERRFWNFLRREGIQLPETNVQVDVPGDFVVADCVWRAQRLIVELDSRTHHLDPVAFEADRARDAALIAAGWRVLRVTWRRLHSDPRALAVQLRSALAA